MRRKDAIIEKETENKHNIRRRRKALETLAEFAEEMGIVTDETIDDMKPVKQMKNKSGLEIFCDHNGISYEKCPYASSKLMSDRYNISRIIRNDMLPAHHPVYQSIKSVYDDICHSTTYDAVNVSIDHLNTKLKYWVETQ